MNSDYLLNFVIPQGPTGPTGPQGDPGVNSGLTSYGGKYSTTNQVFTTVLGTPTEVTLPTLTPSLDLNTANPNALTIITPGDYEITYNILAEVNNAGNLSLSVRNNGTNIPGTLQTLNLTANKSENFSGSIITTLAAGDIIDIALTSTVDNTDGTINQAALTLKKLN